MLPRSSKSLAVCVPFHQFRFQQEEHTHIGLRSLNLAHLITCTTCDEGPPILMGNENWYLLYVALLGAASPPTYISFSDRRSSAPQPFCLAVWTVCQDAFDCFCSVCLHWIHRHVFAVLTFSLSAHSVPFLQPLSLSPVSNNRQFPEIVGDTPVLLWCPPINLSDCGCCRSEVFVVVIVDKTRSGWKRWWRFVPYWHLAVAPNRMK